MNQAEKVPKRCAVYSRREGLYVISTSMMVSGVWADAGPLWRLTPSPKSEEIGKAVLDALQASRTGLPLRDPIEEERECAEMVGFPSWSKFTKGAKLVTVAREGREVTAYATRARRDSFAGDLDARGSKSPPLAEPVGRAILEQLALCS